VGPGPVWTGAKDFSPTGIRSPNRPARSQSLYRLSYPAHASKSMCVNFVDKGLMYDFLLRIGLLLNVGHTAMGKTYPNLEGLKTIFCLFGQ
jgi:hypothetical protein